MKSSWKLKGIVMAIAVLLLTTSWIAAYNVLATRTTMITATEATTALS